MTDFIATVYKQYPPTPNGRTFKTSDGEEYQDHNLRFVEVGKVSGTYSECWEQAKKLVSFPIMEFKEVYRGNS